MFNEYIRSRQDEIINSVLESVKINSVEGMPEEGMPFGRGVNDALEHALKLADKMGFRTKNADGYFGYAEYGEGEEMVAVLGHMDIVPVGDDWTFDPWGEIVDDRIYGRGTLDDKGCIIGALYALDAVRKLAGSLKRRVRIIFGTNEETGSKDMVKYNEMEETPVMGFTPDADYPVIFSEKGIARVVLEKRITDGSLLMAKAGNAVNIVPGTAAMSFIAGNELQHLMAEGIPAHGSTPELGKNAISALMKKAADYGTAGDFGTFVRFFNEHIAEETDGKSLGLSCVTAKFGSTTVNAGLMEGNSECIKITLDCRYPANEDFAGRIDELKKKTDEYGIRCELIKNVEPLYIPENSKLVKTLQAVYNEQTGETAEPVVIGGGTYAKAVKNIVAFGPVFPGQESVIHQKDEFISIEHLMKNIEIMAHAMYRLSIG
jgi:succinyl-diaminopimelate desuccinylase